MSNHPTIAALQARLESEKNKTADENWNTHSGKLVPAALGWIEKDLIKLGHEAATARLLPLLEKAIEVLENLQGHADASLLFPHKDRIDLFKAEQKAREFLSLLKDSK